MVIEQALKPQKAMKYLALAYSTTDGFGGWLGCVGTFPDMRAAIAAAQEALEPIGGHRFRDAFDVVDLDSCQIVATEQTHPDPIEITPTEDADVRD